MDQHENTPEKGTKRIKQVVAVIVILLAVAAAVYAVYLLGQDNGSSNENVNSGSNSNSVANLNSPSNVNAASNQNTNTSSSNVNTSTSSNVNDNTDTWQSYSNAKYKFVIEYPGNMTSWETELSPEVAGQRTDGLLFDAGFRPDGLQGSILVVRVFDESLATVTSVNPDEHGTVTDETLNIGGLTAHELTGNIRRYGIEGTNYTYIVEVNNYEDDADLETFDRMLRSFSLTD